MLDLLRWLGARPLTNGFLRLVGLARRDEPAVGTRMPPPAALPAGPFAVQAREDAPALLIFVPRSLRSRIIDAVTGGYGYSHVAVDLAEIDEPTGKRVMIESAPGHPVQRSFQDSYGQRPFVRVSLQGKGIDLEAFSACIRSKLGEAYDGIEAITFGEVDDPARQTCSDLATVCLPRDLQEDIVVRHAARQLPRASVSAHHVGKQSFRAFVSPNAFAAYFGAMPGERLSGPDQPVTAVRRRKQPRHPLRAKLIFNPIAGGTRPASERLLAILGEMERWDILPEVHVVTPESDVREVAADAVRRGIRLVVVSGGDGTIDNAVGALVGTGVTLGIVPVGTRNNVALSLGIPADIPGAVALLRAGRRLRVDVGHARCGEAERWFLEASAVGLASELFPAADDFQHGKLMRLADLFATFVAAAPSRIRLALDDGRNLVTDEGHMVLLANMPYLGANFQPAAGVAPDDGQLDVLLFGGLNKLDLLGYAVQVAGGPVDDPRVAHFRARTVEVETEPAMLAMADGVMLGEGVLRVAVRARALRVMGGDPARPAPTATAGEPEKTVTTSR
jgi:diacylglycerol kinase family enzyme